MKRTVSIPIWAVLLVVCLALLSIINGIVFAVRRIPVKHTFVGEIGYIEVQEETRYDYYHIYLKPTFDDSREDWVKFKVFGVLDKARVYVGKTVEITYNKTIANAGNVYEVTSMIEATQTSSTTEPLLPKFNEGYENETVMRAFNCTGTLLHSARVESPAPGYFIYILNDTTNQVQQFWVDEREATWIYDGIDQKLANGETDYFVNIEYYSVLGFDNYPMVKMVLGDKTAE